MLLQIATLKSWKSIISHSGVQHGSILHNFNCYCVCVNCFFKKLLRWGTKLLKNVEDEAENTNICGCVIFLSS